MNSKDGVVKTPVVLPESGVPVDVDFDYAELLARYDEERDARLARPTSRSKGADAHDEEALRTWDPYAPRIDREGVDLDLDVVVLGGGFGGITAGKWLKEQGIDNFRIVEQASDFGGTWYWNRYPGAQCDVQSYLYLPYLEESGYMPTKKYVGGKEIFEHAQRLGRLFDIYPNALFQTVVTDVRWDESHNAWVIATDRGDTIRAKFVIRANGPFSKPQYPTVPGIDDFKGKIIHTSRWDYQYTGGDQDLPLDKLRDKRVALIGTGATGIQVAPRLADAAEQVFVVQRTPALVAERNNAPTDPDWVATLTPGWQSQMHENFTDQLSGLVHVEDLVQDVWTQIYRALPGHDLVDVEVSSLPEKDQIHLSILSDLKIVNAVRERVDRTVSNPETAEALKPWFGVVCKRPGFHDEYLPIFNKESVTLINARQGLDRITENGFVANGVEHEVDCLIFATGFETGPHTVGSYGYEILGRDGRNLREHFAGGLKTLHGFFSRDFPNLIELGLSQNAFNVHYTYMLDRKARHATRMIKHALDADIVSFEPTHEAESEWGEVVRLAGESHAAYQATCTPGYYNGQGNVTQGIFREIYQAPDRDYWGLIEEWWENGEFTGLELNKNG
ncbi:NAD(P)/FAD-dependent oxidoreductase [Rhodococcus sp. MS13]|uniref:flavin-containing monooxygenase n=1 Tax=Rhodococcus sp. MS13 TaxID=2579940 RepID=UPI001562B0B7|nr:NAD(P)/FAD-dependent oxidoreductase [Rhodococcus sp. MS13]NRH33641.1 NAD(P)/FAD-dependent oxidoreductase [Rhodococcus sp. MS13]